MWTRVSRFVIVCGLLAFTTSRTRADCPEFYANSQVVFETTRTNTLTVDPAGQGETLEDAGITLRVRILCTRGSTNPADWEPMAGVPGEMIQLYSADLAFCVPLVASRATDADGWTEFHGTFKAGGCVERLSLWADGVFLAEIPLHLNSPDTGTASPGRVDSSDLVALAGHDGRPDRYSICFDFNEDGSTDSSDVAYFASALGTACPN